MAPSVSGTGNDRNRIDRERGDVSSDGGDDDVPIMAEMLGQLKFFRASTGNVRFPMAETIRGTVTMRMGRGRCFGAVAPIPNGLGTGQGMGAVELGAMDAGDGNDPFHPSTLGSDPLTLLVLADSFRWTGPLSESAASERDQIPGARR